MAAAQALLGLGCHQAQGFLLSRPLESAAMESLLARRFVPMVFTEEQQPAVPRPSPSNGHLAGD